jgi:hypothetical protein
MDDAIPTTPPDAVPAGDGAPVGDAVPAGDGVPVGDAAPAGDGVPAGDGARAAPKRRGRLKRPAIVRENLVGPANLAMLQGHLRRLREAYDHPNRRVHLDNIVVAMLYAFYNPTCRSLRTVEGLAKVCQEEIGVDALCRSTTSDAMALFDPELLMPIVEDLRRRLPALARADADLEQIIRQVIAADGSYFNIYADVAWAIHLTRSNGKAGAAIRLNFQIDAKTWVPMAASISGKAQGSETAAVAKELQADAIYLVDRNFIDFEFFHAVLDKGSDFVVRCRNNAPNFSATQERPLSDRDRADGVVSDRIGILPGRGAPDRSMRELILRDPLTGKSIRVLTSLLNVPAYLIGILYRQRWQIELFFRWLKVWANFEHLISHSKNGLTIQFYVAVIGVLLTYVSTGHRVSKYAVSLLTFVAAGRATLEDILPILEKRERERELERARLARKRAQKLGQTPAQDHAQDPAQKPGH